MSPMRSLTVGGLFLSTLLLAACTSSTDATTPPASGLTEIQRVTTGPIDVILLSKEEALPAGKSQSTMEFRTGSDHHLVDVGAVKASATMTMEGMSPMLGSIFVTRGDTPGRYVVDADLGMTGTWRLIVEWDGPAGKGSASFPGTVR